MPIFPRLPISFLLRMRPALRWITKLRSSPRAIAGGFSLGMFIAFTPTLGAQIALAIIFSTFFNFNRAAAILPVWITNPVTVAPIFTFNYWIGQSIWGGPHVSEVSQLFLNLGKTMARLDIWESKQLFYEMINLGPELIIPLCIGSLIVSTVTALLTYFISMRLLYQLAKRKREKKILK